MSQENKNGQEERKSLLKNSKERAKKQTYFIKQEKRVNMKSEHNEKVEIIDSSKNTKKAKKTNYQKEEKNLKGEKKTRKTPTKKKIANTKTLTATTKTTRYANRRQGPGTAGARRERKRGETERLRRAQAGPLLLSQGHDLGLHERGLQPARQLQGAEGGRLRGGGRKR